MEPTLMALGKLEVQGKQEKGRTGHAHLSRGAWGEGVCPAGRMASWGSWC